MANIPFNPGSGDANVWVGPAEQFVVIRGTGDRVVTGARQAPRLSEQERGYDKPTLLATLERLGEACDGHPHLIPADRRGRRGRHPRTRT